MIYNETKVLEALGGLNLSPAEQQKLLDQVGVRVGEAIESQLTDRQLNEYKAIVDANQTVIFAWLEQNMSDYKESKLYKTAEKLYENDPEKVQPEKIVASFGWIKANVKGSSKIIDSVIESMKRKP